ncbi:MAG TPA: DNA translocase FtsK 4TM domain-containing protein [Polyangia bacterium]|jgi:S-DNA-T family DNA segregation ATPase FtsK/SpoIIIE|nr:DNA translocase FtsK 4TM domain-containing protein [Polyangia bacterium]
MAAKNKAESPSKAATHGRRREIAGIVMLAFGLFAGLSMLSMQLGARQMMGPGGAATASGLYGLAGLAGYLFIAGLLVMAVRCFRGKSFVDGPLEAIGAIMLLVAAAVLLHLPFTGVVTAQHGPGGLLGQWMGEVAASFIGIVGAALAATTGLVVALLLVTEIQLQEVAVVLAWAGRQAGRGILAALKGAWRIARAAFPERDEVERAEAEEREERAADIKVVEAERRAVALDAMDDSDEIDDAGRTARDGIPAYADEQASEAVRIGEPRTEARHKDDERAAMAAIFAEMAAVEQVAHAEDEDDSEEEEEESVEASGEDQADERDTRADLPMIAMHNVPAATPAPAVAADPEAEAPPPGDGPIIVEPAPVIANPNAGTALAKPRAAAADGPGFIKLTKGAYQLPGTDMLEYIPPQAHDTDKQALYDMAERLEQAMSNYGVRGKVKEIHMGPVVTMYEFAPAPGTRTGKIANLEKDLAMALEAQAVRIVAPIPGKAVVGVEVPNKTRETVYLKEILQDSCFTGGSAKLQVALGKDIKGSPVAVNLAKMPHLLVAGTTGSGKSVAVNGMIASILYNASPEEVRFIMVDPKMLELSIYEGIPHLLLPVVTDPKKANLALRWAVDEMERRYELLAKTGVRDIAGYNAKVDAADKKVVVEKEAAPAKKVRVVIAGADGSEQEVDLDADSEVALDDTNGIVAAEAPSDEDLSDIAARAQSDAERAAEEGPMRKLPYIVIVIDEFADLMMVAPKDVETSVARIAQKARAAGLHLILATQRPSVDVITGLIKANFPSRIALQVASKIDSRTVLDTSGAETLLGNGDMLFSDRGTKLRRIHGAFLSDDEVHRVVDFLKKQAKPVYDMDILKPREEDADGEGAPADDFHDELYDQAVAIVCDTRQASVSYIQRRLQIGYNRAARLVEQMEREGIVGAANGAKPREVLAPPGEYLQQGV